MGQLWDIAQHYIDTADGYVSERELAARIGYKSSSVFDGWRAEMKAMPGADVLARLATLARVPYRDVLDAALNDAGYLPKPDVDVIPHDKLYRRGRRRQGVQEQRPD